MKSTTKRKRKKSELTMLVNSLTRMAEDDFSKEIVKPLFEAMGYDRVDFHGGTFERGKDLIALRRDPPLNNYTVSVIQSKKIGRRQRIADSQKLRSLIAQLQQCFTDEFPIIDGKKVKADHVFLACPEQIRSRLLEDLNGQLMLQGKTVIPLDGPKIIELIKEYKPVLLDTILSFEDKISFETPQTFSNTELLSALNQTSDIDIGKCYSDLEFFVGDSDSRILLSSDISVSDTTQQCNEEQWLKVAPLLRELGLKLDFSVTIESIESVVHDFETSLEEHQSPENNRVRRQLRATEEKYLGIYEGNNRLLDSIQATISVISKRLNDDGYTDPEFDAETAVGAVESHSKLKKYIQSIPTLDQYTEDLSHQIRTELDKIETLLDESKNIRKDIASLKKSTENLEGLHLVYREIFETYIAKPNYCFRLNSPRIVSYLKESASVYEASVTAINDESRDFNDLQRFLTDTERRLSVIELLKKLNQYCYNPVIFQQKIDPPEDRVSISPHEIFDAGCDVVLYGTAGMGKTTTLQMYAQRFDREEEVLIYLPLNRILNKFIQYGQTENYSTKSSPHEVLINLILLSKDFETTLERARELDRALSSERRFRVILDGLDEAYNKMPTLLASISSFKRKYPSTQLILSSRDCVSYIGDIDFLGITILPFTNSQLYHFINGWFGDNHQGTELIGFIQDRCLEGVLRTPLLATIACNLVEKGIVVPQSEAAIYQKRLALLCGEYDYHKEITRQSLPRDVLEQAAIKIGYHFHSNTIREASFEHIVRHLDQNPTFAYGSETCETIVSELVDPCNVLIYDHISEAYSFGHLRFQEHLASLEIERNRDISLAAIATKDWWRGALVLYSQGNEISALFDEMSISGSSFRKAEATIREMISVRPENTRASLVEMLNGFLKADSMDLAIGLETYGEYTDDGY